MSDPSYTNKILLYGYIAAYISVLYGHRIGVQQNMPAKEVMEAAKAGGDAGYIINIDQHKTNWHFGSTRLYLDKEEFLWFKHLLHLKKEAGSKSRFLFFTAGSGCCKSLIKNFQDAWKDMGLSGSPSFTDIRIAISAFAKRDQTADDRRKVADLMCHDTSTADTFYS